MFTLDPEIQGSNLILRLKGDVLLDDVVPFNDTMREYSKKPDITQLILDLGSVGRMDNAGLGVLVSLNTSMQRYGRRLVLLHMVPHVEEVLRNAEIEGFFPVCENEEELKGFILEDTRKARSKKA